MSKAGWLLQPRTRLGPALPPCPSACPCLITSTTSKACDALPCPHPASWHTTQSFPTKRTPARRIFIALPKKTLNSLKPKPKRNRLQQLAGSVLASKNSSLPRATRRHREAAWLSPKQVLTDAPPCRALVSTQHMRLHLIYGKPSGRTF